MKERDATYPARHAGFPSAVGRASVLAALLLLVSGGAYRLVTGELRRLASVKVILPQPLSGFPMTISAWAGEEAPLSDSVLKVAQNDDYISRRYANADSGEVIELYVSYTARPRTMLGHRPTVCYPSQGWIHEGTRESEIVEGEQRIPCLLHSFSPPELGGAKHLVLNYYILEGRATIDEKSFRGISWRDPNLGRDPTRYVAQVQIIVLIRTDVDSATRTASTFAKVSMGPLMTLFGGARESGV